MITLVGVGHVFDLRTQVRELIVQRNPPVVGVELDASRLQALKQPAGRGGAPLPYRFLALVQGLIARKFGGQVGDEMLAAVDAAREVGAEVALLDQDASATFQRLWTSLSFGERVKFVTAIIGGLFVTRRRVEKELAKFQTETASYFEEFGDQFPQMKRVLVDERDVHMANALSRIHEAKGDVVAVIGDGHVDGVRRLLGTQPVEVVRLAELRSGAPSPPPQEPSGTSVTFSYELPPGGR